MANDHEQQQQDLARAVARVFLDSPEGRRVLDELNKRCRTFSNAHDATSQTQTAFNLGAQSIGQWINGLLQKVQAKPLSQETVNHE